MTPAINIQAQPSPLLWAGASSTLPPGDLKYHDEDGIAPILIQDENGIGRIHTGPSPVE